ncbi:MAG: hypothetical protein JXQ67_08010 [Campylobacterales bacterium]|nr:hypothetical protein [Campylobacterales bacterium]
MSEQSKILAQMQELIMEILKTGATSPEQGVQLDNLESKLFEQKCFQASTNDAYENIGEEIAYLFFNDKQEKAIKKLQENQINVEDFVGFAEYFFEDDEPVEMFDSAFKESINKALSI